MKQYPSIPIFALASNIDGDVYIYEKLDGSNIRVEVEEKKGIINVGKRHGVLDSATPFLSEAEALARPLEPMMQDILHRDRRKSGVFFFEFYGENSFAGEHQDEPHYLKLIDITLFQRGFLIPAEYHRLADPSGIPMARLIYQGPFGSLLTGTPNISQVWEGTFPGASKEGIIIKTMTDPKAQVDRVFKLKTKAWVEAVKAKYGHDPKLLEKTL